MGRLEALRRQQPLSPAAGEGVSAQELALLTPAGAGRAGKRPPAGAAGDPGRTLPRPAEPHPADQKA
ncbi:MAG: hypothetical protein AB1634_00945 [Thermodesulfobacteriota bacterium]